jgi:hypothetical protein
MTTPEDNKATTINSTQPKKMMFLKEFASFEYDEADVKTREPNKPLILKGILQRANALNQNGRVYPKDILEREIRNYDKLIRENRAFGELDHAAEPIVNMKNVSHMIKEIWMEGDTVYGRVQILDTPCGQIIKAIIEAGGKPGISSRALGSLVRENNANVVQDDLQIICWDFVSEPSTQQAFMLPESKQLVIPVHLTKADLVDRAANTLLSMKVPSRRSK